MIKRMFVLVLGLALLMGCETKFSVNGDSIEKPIVHFLLDQGETYHFLKLNKTFLKDGDANTYAKDPQNSYFDNVVATVTEVKNGNEVKKWILKDTMIHNKKSGVFYYPNQKLYYFKEANLDPDGLYKLKININDGQFIVTGQTELVKGVSISYPTHNMSFKLADNNVELNGYKAASVRFTPNDDVPLYKAQIRFDYEEYTATDSSEKSLYWNVGQIDKSDISPTVGAVSANGEGFYVFLQNSIKKDPNVVRRNVRGMAVILTAASNDLYTYMLTSQPSSSSFTQSKPKFSNVDGGLGIFASRLTVTQYKAAFTPPIIRALDINSTKELCLGQYTGALKFCSDLSADSGFPFYCGN